MKDNLADIKRLVREHRPVLGTMGSCKKSCDALMNLRISDVANADGLREMGGRLAAIHRDLSEHMRFEEQQVLPTLARHAAEIIARGLPFEHAEILDTVAVLIERVTDLADTPADLAALTIKQAKIEEKLQDIRGLVDSHSEKAETIFHLAREALESTTGAENG